MITDGFNDGRGDGVAGFHVVFISEKPFGHFWVIDEFDLKQHNDGLVEMGVLAGEAEGANAVLEMAAIVFAVADGFCFGGVSAKGFEGGGDFFNDEVAKGTVAFDVRIEEVHVFPVGVFF